MTQTELNPSDVSFAGGTATIEAFTNPDRLTLPAAVAMIDSVVACRPDADKLREALAIRFIKSRGIDMYGTEIHDSAATTAHDADRNPTHLYVSPYARPTAGSTIMPTYQDARGEIYVVLVKNWQDHHDHSKGMREYWQFPGGYMDCYPNGKHDKNLDEAAIRELKEETHIALDAKPEQLFVRSDAAKGKPAHCIDAFYLADMGRHHEAPPVLAGDDVAVAKWVNIRDIQPVSSPPSYQAMVDGKADPFLADHVELLEKGIARVRAKLFPLHEPKDDRFTSPLDEHAQAHYDRVAQAHGFKPALNINITINGRNAVSLPAGGWTAHVQDQGAREPIATLH